MLEPAHLQLVEPLRHKELIDTIKKLLAQAEAGEVRGIAFISLGQGEYEVSWAGKMMSTFELAGAFQKLNFELLSSV